LLRRFVSVFRVVSMVSGPNILSRKDSSGNVTGIVVKQNVQESPRKKVR